MSKDKKGCGNCIRLYDCQEEDDFKGKMCSKWLHNPHLWLDILLTEPGWYFMKKPKDKNYTIRYIFQDEIDSGRFNQAGFLFQGPIKPEDK